jgi:hypothetical protein
MEKTKTKKLRFSGFLHFLHQPSDIKPQTFPSKVKHQTSNLKGDPREEIPGGAGVVVALRCSIGLQKGRVLCIQNIIRPNKNRYPFNAPMKYIQDGQSEIDS